MCTLTSFMIHDSLRFTKIHVDMIQYNSFMMSFVKGLKSRFTKAESSTEGSTHNSTHLRQPTPDSTQYLSTKTTIQLIYDVSTLPNSILVISYVTLLGLLPKSCTFLSVYNSHKNTKEAYYSYVHYVQLGIPIFASLAQKIDCNRDIESIHGFFLENNGLRFTWDSCRLGEDSSQIHHYSFPQGRSQFKLISPSRTSGSIWIHM